MLGSGHPEKQALVYAEVTNPQSLNKYQYCFNNPLRYVDPDGQNPQDGYDIRFQKLHQDRVDGKITEQQYWDSLRAAGYGALAGVGVIVASRGGSAAVMALLRWATQNPQSANRISEEIVQASSGNPSPAKLSSEAIGLAREARVAEIVGGQVVRQPIVVANVGRSEIDVVAKATGDIIAVGGPAKAINLSALGKQLSILKTTADERGVKAVAYFEKGTSESALKVARRRLGAENVHIFEMK